MKDKTAFTILKRNPLFLIAFLLFFPAGIFLTGYFHSFSQGISGWVEGWPEDFGAYWEIYSVALMGIYLFLFFLFFAFEYISLARNSGVTECARAINSGGFSLYRAQCGVLLTLSLAAYVIVMLFFIFAYYRWEIAAADYLLYVAKFAFIHVFLTAVLASAVGVLIGVLVKRVIGYFVMLIISVFEIISFKFSLPALFVTLFGAKSAYAGELLNLFSADTDKSIVAQYGFSVQPYRVYVLLFWIALVIFALLNVDAVKRRQVKKAAMSTLCVALAVIFAIIAVTPTSRLCLNNDSQFSSITGDYSVAGTMQEHEADFTVTEYRMLLQIREKLSAKTTVLVENAASEDYRFTLWSAFQVSAVSDQTGAALSFERDGCYLMVHAKGKTESLTFEYEGFSYRHLSNSQAIYLPGYFPYYPLPGFLRVVSSDERGEYFANNQSESSVRFQVEVRSKLRVFSNLDAKDKNCFTGTASSLTLYGGFLAEKEISGVRVIYPYLDGQSRPELMKRCIQLGLDAGTIRERDVVFIGPRLTASQKERWILFKGGCYVSTVLCFELGEEYALPTEPVYY